MSERSARGTAVAVASPHPQLAPGRRFSILLVAALTTTLALGLAATAQGSPSLRSKSLRADLQLASNLRQGTLQQSRLTLAPEVTVDLSRRLRLTVGGRMEYADDDYGLGTRSTYSGLSRPWRPTDQLSVEADEISLSYRGRRVRWSAGKLSLPWGTLDGLRVTDQVDAARQRDFLLLDQRPDRLTRWGTTLGMTAGAWRLDLATLLDPTVDQLPISSSPLAPASLQADAANGRDTRFPITDRSRYLEDATVATRLQRRLDNGSLTLIALSGPVREPIVRQLSAVGAAGSALAAPFFDYPRSEQFGFSIDRSMGSAVWRFESTYSGNHPVPAATAAGWARTSRWLAGIGVDWNTPGEWFINAQVGHEQLGTDPQSFAGQALRDAEQTILTLLAKRDFANARWTARFELIGSLRDGDVLLRPELRYQINDSLTASGGIDWMMGDRAGVFGQFQDASRAWLRFTVNL